MMLLRTWIWLDREIYHSVEVTAFAPQERGDFGGNDSWDMGQKPTAKGHFAHRPGRGFDLCLGQPQREPCAWLVEPTGVDGLWDKGECASFTQYFFW